MKEGDIELLKQIAEFEETPDAEAYKFGWTWRHVRIQPATLNRFCIEGWLDILMKTNSYTGYWLTEKGREMAQIGDLEALPPVETSASEVKLPDDLFEVIEGYSDVKDLVRQAIESEKPVNILFTGVPSSAKTMFLLELARTGAPYILGSQSTKAGIASLLFDTEPRILLVDEIDRIGTKDIAVLLSLAQTGIVSETKHGRRREVKLDTRVFAASNTLKMAPELLARFLILQFKPYSKSDFLTVATNLLKKQESTDEELAIYIAERVWSLSQRFPDPRQAVRVARLAGTKDEADRIFRIIARYSDAG
ncbi:MAG: hypothetical protein DDT29_01936 [Dehalococcoidia bacterium]|nr:hypothetical protein [Bacillota bacterium]